MRFSLPLSLSFCKRDRVISRLRYQSNEKVINIIVVIIVVVVVSAFRFAGVLSRVPA